MKQGKFLSVTNRGLVESEPKLVNIVEGEKKKIDANGFNLDAWENENFWECENLDTS